MSILRRTAVGAGWQSASIVVQSVLTLVVSAVLARHVSPRDFGVVAIAQVLVGFTLLLSEGGVSHAVVRQRDLQPGHVRAAFWMSVAFATACVGVLWAVSPLLSRFFAVPGAVGVLRGTSISLLLGSVGLVSTALLEREMNFRRVLVANLSAYVVGYGAVGITLAVLGYGVWSIVAAIVCRGAVQSVAACLLRPHPVAPSFTRAEARDILHFGGGLTLSRFFDYFAWQADYLVVGKVLGPAALGFYQRAFELMELPGRFVGKIIEKLLFSTMARIQDDVRRLRLAHLNAIGLSNLLVLPVAAVMIANARLLVEVIYGPAWLPAVPALRVLLLSVTFRTSYRVTEALLRAVGAVYQAAGWKALAGVNVTVAAGVGQLWGIQGVAAGVFLATAVNYLLVLQIGLRRTEAGWGDYLRVLVPGALLGVVAYAASAGLLLTPSRLGSPAAFLVASGACAVAAVLAVVWVWPAVIGGAGLWAVGKLPARVTARSVVLRRVASAFPAELPS